MKTQIALFAGNANPYQFEQTFDGKSAFERALAWALAFPKVVGKSDFALPVILTDSETDEPARKLASGFANLQIISRPAWSIAELTAALGDHCKQEGVQTLLFGMAASPFLCTGLTKTVLDHHLRYVCEYTFADGYAQGLVPVAIDAGALDIVAKLAEKDFADKPVTAEALFSVIKEDINSFEVETVISPEDLRSHRFDFSCLSKRTLEVCKNLFAAAAGQGGIDTLDAVALGRLGANTGSVKRTIPSFYNIQVSAWTPCDSLYSPYTGAFRETRYMNTAKFKALVKDMARLSSEAVVSLSAWGEPLFHPDFAELIAATLAEPGLSLLIETDGALVTPKLAAEVADIAKNAEKRTNGHQPVYWVVALDALDEAKYREIHPLPPGVQPDAHTPTLEKATAAVDILEAAFPGAVYPQFVRMNENEEQLEPFYRAWKERGNLIIQKYDWFCGQLPDRRPADLSPLERNPCWHLLRDMVILADGTVPACRECLYDNPIGNVFAENVISTGLEVVWGKGGSPMGLCKDCDEYYTFNF
jgi:spiro-SPASM protein